MLVGIFLRVLFVLEILSTVFVIFGFSNCGICIIGSGATSSTICGCYGEAV
jgi:hypothetical protein